MKMNTVKVEGRLQSYQLTDRELTDGRPAIAGNLILATNNTGTEQVRVEVFATPTWSSGKPNSTYTLLRDIQDGKLKTVAEHGINNAAWLSAGGASVQVQYFASKQNPPKSVDDLARSQRVRAAFINMNTRQGYSNEWRVDMLITNVSEVPANETTGVPAYVAVSGYIVDDWRKQLFGVEFRALSDAARNYFLSMAPSVDNPVCTWVRGKLATLAYSKVENSAFGDPEITETKVTIWEITGASPTTDSVDSDAVLGRENYEAYMHALETAKQEAFDKATGASDDGDLPF